MLIRYVSLVSFVVYHLLISQTYAVRQEEVEPTEEIAFDEEAFLARSRRLRRLSGRRSRRTRRSCVDCYPKPTLPHRSPHPTPPCPSPTVAIPAHPTPQLVLVLTRPCPPDTPLIPSLPDHRSCLLAQPTVCTTMPLPTSSTASSTAPLVLIRQYLSAAIPTNHTSQLVLGVPHLFPPAARPVTSLPVCRSFRLAYLPPIPALPVASDSCYVPRLCLLLFLLV